MPEANQAAGDGEVGLGSVAGHLAEWCAARGRGTAGPGWSALAIGRARDAVEDTVACMIAGAAEPPAVAARRAAAAWG
ncbi:hypothetical protein, partial [Thalassobaculum sp.]|uniref:hypothetical protein n=1 Tax=Thalassobaculum sp. TaxID=2022740 RepID=UPI0032ED8D9F